MSVIGFSRPKTPIFAAHSLSNTGWLLTADAMCLQTARFLNIDSTVIELASGSLVLVLNQTLINLKVTFLQLKQIF